MSEQRLTEDLVLLGLKLEPIEIISRLNEAEHSDKPLIVAR
jgi:hypothetical protein